ncbi:MAG: histidine phosphatase family protein [Candidatus Latescibacteria bacterium]|nr:histidine phosphatase family protein [Candidatus Latescibacterota bacterium]
MKRLYVVRHAKSSWSDPALGDFDRPLNQRGKRDAPLMGTRLKEGGAKPDMIVCSPAKRAVKTARAIAKTLGFPTGKIVEETSVYEASLYDLLAVVRNIPDTCDEAIMVGHNPGFSDLAGYLASDSHVNMPTCAVCCVDLEVDSWASVTAGLGRMVSYDYPKKHA